MDQTFMALLADEHDSPRARRMASVVGKAYISYVEHMHVLPIFNEFADDFFYYYLTHLEAAEEIHESTEILYEFVKQAVVDGRYGCDLIIPQREVW